MSTLAQADTLLSSDPVAAAIFETATATYLSAVNTIFGKLFVIDVEHLADEGEFLDNEYDKFGDENFRGGLRHAARSLLDIVATGNDAMRRDFYKATGYDGAADLAAAEKLRAWHADGGLLTQLSNIARAHSGELPVEYIAEAIA